MASAHQSSRVICARASTPFARFLRRGVRGYDGPGVKATLFVPLAARFHWAVVTGAILECLAFGAAGGLNLWWYSPTSGRIDPAASLLVYVSSLALFALGAGFGLGAFLLSLHWVAVRSVGAAIHLIATALAAWAFGWLGASEMRVDPNSYGYWPPWIAFALAAGVMRLAS